jgi:hypothetical protein
MAHRSADRVKETTTTTGTGAVTLGGAVTGFRAFSSVLSDGDTCQYTIAHATANEWEVGLGTYNAGALTRTTVYSSSNAGAAVNFSSGSKEVFITMSATAAQVGELTTGNLTSVGTSTIYGKHAVVGITEDIEGLSLYHQTTSKSGSTALNLGARYTCANDNHLAIWWGNDSYLEVRPDGANARIAQAIATQSACNFQGVGGIANAMYGLIAGNGVGELRPETTGTVMDSYAGFFMNYPANSYPNSGVNVKHAWGVYIMNQGGAYSNVTFGNVTNLYVETASGANAGGNMATARFEGGYVGFGPAWPISGLYYSSPISASAWGLNGIGIVASPACEFTDTSTAAGATATFNAAHVYHAPTLKTSLGTVGSPTTYTYAATLLVNGNPTPGANVTFTNQFALGILGNVFISGGRFMQAKGANVASTNDMTLGQDGNFFLVTGTTQVNRIANTRWLDGATFTLKFDQSLTVKHNQVASGVFCPMKLAGARDYVAAAGDTMSFIYDGLSASFEELTREVAPAATQAEQEAATSTTTYVSPGRQHFHPSAAKCWLKCGVAADIQSSYNITSLADTAAGRVTVTIGTDFSSTNWCAVTAGLGSTAVTNAKMIWLAAQAAGTCELDCADLSATPVVEDPTSYYMAGYGDHA